MRSPTSDQPVLSSRSSGTRHVSAPQIPEACAGSTIATFKLATKKPWAIDTRYFTPCRKPLYLTSMAVDPARQRHGIGRLCLEDARRVAREWPAQAIRLDAYNAPAGAGDFYAKCGFREVGRVTYRSVPLLYFELVL